MARRADIFDRVGARGSASRGASVRIFKDRVYLVWTYPGISGFRQWDRKEYALMLGAKAKQSGYHIDGEYAPAATDRFRDRLLYFDEREGTYHSPVRILDGMAAAAHVRQNPWDVLYRIEV